MLAEDGMEKSVLAGSLSPDTQMEEVSARAFAAYRRFVRETPGFYDYFIQATPVEELQYLRIGSRPGSYSPRMPETGRMATWKSKPRQDRIDSLTDSRSVNYLIVFISLNNKREHPV
jgi:hypothetical protein